MPQLSLTNFDRRGAELQRQQQLAQLLQQQALEPIQTFSGGGVPAPISPLQGLAKLLQTYAAVSKGKKAAKEEADIKEAQRTEAMDAIDRLTSRTESTITPFKAPVLDGGNQGLLSALKGRLGLGGNVPEAPAPPPLVQGPVAQTPPPAAMPPPVASDMPARPAAPLPVEQPAQLPPAAKAGEITPIIPVEAMAPPQATAVPLPETQRAVTPEDRQRMALEAMMSGNPFLKDIAPGLYEQAAKDAQAARMAAAMKSDNLPPDIKASFDRHVAAGDIQGAMALVDKASEPRVINNKIVQRNLQTGKYDTVLDAGDKWEEVPLPPEAQAMTPPGTIVLKNSSGDIKTIKLSDAESAAKFAQDLHKIGVQQAPQWANVGLSRQRLALDQAKFARGLDSEGRPVKPLTEYQGKSVEYLNAALSGNDRLNTLAKGGIYGPATPTDSLFTKGRDGVVKLVLRNEKDRQFMQAAKEWIAPILRKDTGAAVTDGELATYMDIYIPKYEDSQKVRMQKAQARGAKMKAMYGANRTVYDQTFGAPPQLQVLTEPEKAAPVKPYSDPAKEQRYQQWKARQGG